MEELARRLFLRGFLALGASLAAGRLPGGEKNPDTGLDLQETLEKGLRVRRPQDSRFVAHVALLVDQGVLPESLVMSTFQWARKKRKHPFQYFERALLIQAEKLGISI